MTPIFAHFGHWYFQLLYAVPVGVIVGALWIQGWREKRQAGRTPPENREG